MTHVVQGGNIAVVGRALLQEHTNEHIVEQTVALFVPHIKEKLAVVCQALFQERIHEHIVEPSFPQSAVVGSGNRGKLGFDSEEELLEAATGQTRDEEDEYFQAVHKAS